MKSDTRTVLDTIKTDTISYTSGILDVGDLRELAIDFVIMNAVGGKPQTIDLGGGAYNYIVEYGFSISRITAQDTPVLLHRVIYSSDDQTALGGVLYPKGIKSLNMGACLDGMAFGDRIRIDLINEGKANLAFAVSILGK